MFWKMLLIENTKKRSLLWIELGVIGILVAAVFVMGFNDIMVNRETFSPEELQEFRTRLYWPGGLLTIITLAGWLGGFPLIILAGAVATQEYTWRTMRLWLCRGVSRSKLLLAKATALLSPTILVVLVPLLVGGVVIGIFTPILDGSLHIEKTDPILLLLAVVRTVLALLPYVGLTFLLGIATRSKTVTIAGGLTYFLVLENKLLAILAANGDVRAKISACLPKALAMSLLSLSDGSIGSSAAESGLSLLTPDQATIGIGLWVIFSVVTALFIFRRQDLAE